MRKQLPTALVKGQLICGAEGRVRGFEGPWGCPTPSGDRAGGGGSPRLGTKSWLSTGAGWGRLPADGNGFSSPPPHGQGALTRPLVFDEEELQALLEGVLIHVELHLHPAGTAPMGTVSAGGMGRTPAPSPGPCKLSLPRAIPGSLIAPRATQHPLVASQCPMAWLQPG